MNSNYQRRNIKTICQIMTNKSSSIQMKYHHKLMRYKSSQSISITQNKNLKSTNSQRIDCHIQIQQIPFQQFNQQFMNCQQLDSMKMKNQTSNNFAVGIRIRPPSSNSISNLKIQVSKSNLQIQNPHQSSYSHKIRKFSFDSIFNPQATNSQIFKQIALQKIQMMKKGYNIALMAYGVTGSGKTYTIFGNDQNKGMAMLSFQHIMCILPSDTKYSVSYLQVYNENVHDLLSDQQNLKNLHILEDQDGNIVIPDLRILNVITPQDIVESINKGNKRRKSSSTVYNEVSSRSHAILQLYVHNPNLKINNKLTVIDLAGSQRNSSSERSILLKEGSSINKSLLSLANCIKSLEKQQTYVPYRNSKLTRILKENLAGNSYNILIGCLSTNALQYQQTMNTLQYASQASNIKRYVQGNDYYQGYNDQVLLCPNCDSKIKWKYIYEIMNKANKQTFNVMEYKPIIESQLEQIKQQMTRIISSISNYSMFSFQNQKEMQQRLNDVKQLINQHQINLLDKLQNYKQTTAKNSKHQTPKTSIPSEHIKQQQILVKKFQLKLDLSSQGMLMEKSKQNYDKAKSKTKIVFKTPNQQNIISTQRMMRDLESEKDVESWKSNILKKINDAINNPRIREISQFQISNNKLKYRPERKSSLVIHKNPWDTLEIDK